MRTVAEAVTHPATIGASAASRRAAAVRLAWTVLLPVWFAVLGIGNVLLLGPDAIGVDSRIYYRGSAAWLAGADPWRAIASYTVSYGTNYYHYAALPSATVLLAPLALLPEPMAVTLMVAAGIASAVYVVRATGLAWWWLLFPPLLEGVWAGNPGVVLLALLLSGRGAAVAVVPVLKAYLGIAPFVEGRLRPLLVGALVGLGTVVVAPGLWLGFLGQAGFVSARLMSESAGGYAASAFPPLYLIAVPAVLALLAIRRREAAWLAVPALWPASEFHYSTLAMPVIRASGSGLLLAVALALPIRGLPAAAVAVYAILAVWPTVRSRFGR